jgi:REP element-mobilizing transposase RayT
VRNEYKDILLKSRQYCIEQKGMELYAWCIMTSHVHMIIGSHGESLSGIMRRHTSEKLRLAIQQHPAESRREWMLKMMKEAGQANSNNRGFQLWRQDNHPIQLSNPLITQQKLNYIHQNPVVAGFVDKPEEYLYSSARDYYDIKGMIAISLPDPIVKTV